MERAHATGTITENKSYGSSKEVTYMARLWVPFFNQIRHVTLPDSVITIEDGAFSNFPALVSITIPKSVRHIGKDAFANCPSLVLPGLRHNA